jgi:16S rRNA (cytidine1402-2'-O)-methyltransferase
MLYLIATPIGNLGDITYRAVQVMQQCDYILCEDTRRSRILLNHYGISKPLKSYFRFNEKKREQEVLADLKNGKTIALISDAGTPGICDPGMNLVNSCREANLKLSVLPGPFSGVVALTLSGSSTEQFQFLGFLPKKKKLLSQILSDAFNYPGSSICFETPHRLLKTLQLIHQLSPTQPLCVARELSKTFEECLYGPAERLINHFTHTPPRGEMVLIVSGKVE